MFKQKDVPVFHGNFEVDDEKDKLRRANLIGQIVMEKKDHQFKNIYHGKGGIHFTLRDYEIDRLTPGCEFLSGKKYAFFLSDNNYLQFRILLHTLGTMDEKELDSCIPAVQKMPNEKMKMLLKREFRNNDFVNEYASIDWSQIFHPVSRHKM